MKPFRLAGWLCFAVVASFGQAPAPFVQGLQLPYRLLATPGHNLLAAEGGTGANEGRVSLVTAGGSRQSLLEGLPAGVNGESQLPVGPVGLALRDKTLFIAIGDGDSDAQGPMPGSTIGNPKGTSSLLFSSVLRVDFTVEPDRIGAPFRLTLAGQQQLADGNDVVLENGMGDRATVRLLIDFPDLRPFAPTLYKHSDPYALVLDRGNANALYLVDAGQDTVVRIDTETGRYRVISRFERAPAPPPFGRTDAVPTSVTWYGDKLLVTQLTGFPFTNGASRAVLVDVNTGAVEPFINGLTNAMDILPIARAEGRPRFIVLEHSGSITAPPPGVPGRLLLFDTPAPTTLMPTNAATSLAWDAESGNLYVSDLGGNIYRMKLP